MKKIFSLHLLFLTLFLFSCSSEETTNDSDSTLSKSGEGTAFSEEATTKSNASGANAKYQSNDTLDLKLTPFIPDYPDLGEVGKQLLASRLNQAVSNYAFGGDGGNPRFIIGPNINLLSKNVTATSPTKYANTYEVTLLSLDVVSETTFASYSFTVKGVGDTPSKAFINAFRNTTFETENFFNFLKKTQDKIAQFYDSNCDKMILEAESEAKTREYDKAYALLQSIPIDAASCFEKALEKKQEYFQLSLNTNCQPILANMKAELGKANDPSASGFNDAAMSYYAMLDQSSDCYNEAEEIYQEYLKKLKPEAKRDWDMQMKSFEAEVAKAERLDALKRDSISMSYDYLKHKNEMQAQAEIQGNKKLLQKYQYDQLPWLRRVFHLGKHDPFDGVDK